jgi:hypothetical protein
MKDKIQPACAFCKFWEKIPDTDYGECHRHAPRPFQDSSQIEKKKTSEMEDWPLTMLVEWPVTDFWGWCGDFSAGTPPEF